MTYYFAILSFFLVSLVKVSSILASWHLTVPPGRAIDLDELINLSENFGGFLIVAGGILAGIVIIGTGITYLLSGGDAAKVKTAKDMFRAGIIGSLVIFGVGIIINTVRLFAGNPGAFFQ